MQTTRFPLSGRSKRERWGDKADMARPPFITCACGRQCAVPVHGAIPKRCEDCQQSSLKVRNRERMLVYSRRPETKARRKRNKELYGSW